MKVVIHNGAGRMMREESFTLWLMSLGQYLFKQLVKTSVAATESLTKWIQKVSMCQMWKQFSLRNMTSSIRMIKIFESYSSVSVMCFSPTRCMNFWYHWHMLLKSNIHTPDRKTITPALRQTGTEINTNNTWCVISKWGSFNIKLHMVSKPLRSVSAIISLLEQNNTQFLSLPLEVGVTVFLCGVRNCLPAVAHAATLIYTNLPQL